MNGMASPPESPPARRWRWRRALLVDAGVLVVVLALAALAAMASFAWLGSSAALEFVAREISVRSGGALQLEGTRGSLLSTLQARSLTYRAGAFSLVAEDVALEWTPAALWTRTVTIRGLGARRITVTLPPASGPTSLPATLVLPFEVAIEHVAVGELVLIDGDARRELRGVTLGYRGGAAAHQVYDAAVTVAAGRFSGFLRVDAVAPFPTGGAVEFVAAEGWKGLAARASIGGRLDVLDLALEASAGEATARGYAQVTPFADALLPTATIDIRQLDLAALATGLPKTTINGNLTASVAADGSIAGALTATNASAGPVDRDRLPLTALAASYTFADGTLTLSDLVGEAGPRARARGSGRIPLAQSGAFGSWRLALAQVDLSRLHSALVATALSGRFNAVLSASGQELDGDLAQDNLGLAFAATVRGESVEVSRLRARAGSGEFVGRGRFDLAGARRFAVEGKASGLDPSQLGRFPSARLDGELTATGVLAPAWSADVALALAPTSRFRDAPLSGNARGLISATTLQDARIDVKLAGAQLKASGSVGTAGSRLDAAVDVPDLERLRGVLADWTPAVLATLRGRVRGKATLSGPRDDLAVTFEAHGESLQHDGITIGALDVRGDVAAPSAGRRFAIKATATKLATPAGSYATAAANLDGTIGAHTVSFALVGKGIDATLAASGGFTDGRWQGMLAALRNRGANPVELTAPARLELGAGRVELTEARLAVAQGKLHVASLIWADGRLSTAGTFDAVPLAAIAEMAGSTLPLRSTLTLAGEWDIAPGRTGSLSLRRQQGDLYAGRNAALEAGEIALGVSQLEVKATLVDGALAATFDAAATRVGTLRGDLAIGRGRGADAGPIDGEAPLSGTLVAQLASLAPLQPFIGTAARVDGRVDAELRLGGTVRAATFTGKLSGTGLRLDAPVYGLHWGDGVLRATLADDRLTLDEFSFRAGDGKFAASGVIAAARSGDHTGAKSGDAASGVGTGTRLTWQADRLRATNRPDLRLVVSGNGDLAFVDQHLAVSGTLKVDEGRVDIETAAPGTTLGDDVVIVGRPRPPATSAKRFGAVPFGLDLALDLGPALQIAGEGLQARLGGRIRVSAVPDGVLTAKGTLRTVNGSYYAFGQRLTIERGRLIFDGPIDNPALDIIALRKNLQVEAGVRVTGTARVPRIELTSEPPVPDGEKLSWLVLGQGLDQTTTGGDTAALQAAASMLFGGGRMPIGTTLAQSIGLDDIAVRGSRSIASTDSNAPGVSGQVLAVGKRLSDRLYIVYEQGLSVANNALRIEFALTRNITLRAEAGLISGVGIYYRKSFD